MDGMSREEFERMKQNAGERIMQMKKEGLPFPDFVTIPKREGASAAEDSKPKISEEEEKTSETGKQMSAHEGHRKNGFLPFIRYLNIPEITENPDGMLLLALILLLSHEGADNRLILALAYILL